ncbi:hypothetical protein DFH06DRAFT_1135291 [Mycena polygramma]|nr:hypothetical protein DFH06DRAFT_1135291 [Mycena polygramma]
MARRAADTRLRNSTAHQQELTPSTPLGPTTAQNRPPQTPLATVHPDLRSYPSQNASSPFQNTSSSSPFNFNQTPFPPPQAPMRAPSLRPQNYQPAYPDFTQLTPFPSSDTTRAEQPSSSGPSMADFSRMMETLTPEQLAQLNEILGMSLPPVAHAPHHGLRSNNGSDGNGHDGNGNDGDDDADNDAMARGGNAWNAHTDNNQEDEDEDRLHENAQTSLDVTMYDVQRKRKRSRLVPRWATQDSGDESPSTAPAKKRRRKKRAHRRQKSRSIKELTPERRRLVEATYKFITKRVVIEKPFPDASESGDPGAEDDEFQTLIEESWCDALEFLGVDPNDIEDLCMEEILLIRSRISQVRGHVMNEADKLVRSEYGFVDILSLDDPTPEKIAEVRESNRELVDELDQVFMFKDPKDISNLATVGHHKIFQKLLNAAFFSKERKKRRSHYFDGLEMLPGETFGLMMDAIVCGIDRWKTGEWEMVKFEAEVYRPIHQQSMIFIGKWIAEFDKDVYPENLAKARLREMLTKARKLSNVPAEPAKDRRSVFNMSLFS